MGKVMTTITLKINEKSKAGKMLKDLIEFFSKDKNDVEIVPEKSPYNAKFVKEVLNSVASKKRYEVKNVDELWESL